MSYIEAERDLPMHLVFRTDNFATLYRDDYGWFTAMHHMDSPHNVGLDAALSAAEDSLLAQANESLHRRGTVPGSMRREIGAGIVEFTALRVDTKGECITTPEGFGYPVLATAKVRIYD